MRTFCSRSLSREQQRALKRLYRRHLRHGDYYVKCGGRSKKSRAKKKRVQARFWKAYTDVLSVGVSFVKACFAGLSSPSSYTPFTTEDDP